MVRDQDHGPLLDRDRDSLRDRVRPLLPRLLVLPTLTGTLDPWADLAAIRDRVLDGARIDPGDTVVDVGAGTGLLTLGALAREGEEGTVVAVDPSVDALEELRRLAPRGGVFYLVGCAEVLPLPDEFADAIVGRSVFVQVEDRLEVAREFHRVLRPAGRVSVFEPLDHAGCEELAGALAAAGFDDVQREDAPGAVAEARALFLTATKPG